MYRCPGVKTSGHFYLSCRAAGCAHDLCSIPVIDRMKISRRTLSLFVVLSIRVLILILAPEWWCCEGLIRPLDPSVNSHRQETANLHPCREKQKGWVLFFSMTLRWVTTMVESRICHLEEFPQPRINIHRKRRSRFLNSPYRGCIFSDLSKQGKESYE